MAFHECKESADKNEIELVYRVSEKLGSDCSTSNIRVLVDLGVNGKDHLIVNVKRL